MLDFLIFVKYHESEVKKQKGSVKRTVIVENLTKRMRQK